MTPLLVLPLALSACQIDAGPDQDDPGPDPDVDAGRADVYEPAVEFTEPQLEKLYGLSPEEIPVPQESTNAVSHDPRAVRMGHFLFFDERLSGDGSVSCATCHQPDHGFADSSPLSTTSMGTTGRNTPGLLNVAHHLWYFWDGRSDSLWAQAIQPIEAFNEMGMTRLEMAHLVYRDAELRQAYEAIFGPMPDLSDTARFPEKGRPVADDADHPYHLAWEAMSEADRHTINTIASNITKTIAAYEVKLVSLDSPFDTFVDGIRQEDPAKQAAISDDAQRGLKLFLGKASCISCHQGAMFTTHTFHNIGLAQPEWAAPQDDGRYSGAKAILDDPFNAVGDYSDETDGSAALRLSSVIPHDRMIGQFRTPILRNVALTAPYMHAGQHATLEDVVRFYSELDEEPQIGTRDEKVKPINLTDQEIDELVAFLETLTGEPVPDEYTVAPPSPLLDE